MSGVRARKSSTGSRTWLALKAGAGVLVAVVLAVLLARWLRAVPAVEEFVARYPGVPEVAGAPVGVPTWTAVLHFLNMLLLMLLVRSGLSMRSGGRPPAQWTRRNSGLLRTKRPPQKISITLWLHLTVDVLWITSGVIFYVLLFSTGRWLRLVPTTWESVAHAGSVLLQYISLAWPADNGWVAYNSLQVFAYASVVFVAGPLAILSGLRLSPIWPSTAASRISPDRARRVHFWTMVYFVGFTIVHVILVLATGARRNLNHMFAGRADESWAGVLMFALALAVLAGAWVLTRPVFLRPVASLTGKVTR